MFLHLDNPRASTGGTLVLVYDQSTRPGGKPLRFKEILKHVNERIDDLPVLQQKLVKVPFSLDHPYWVKDKNFQLEHHVHHVRLPYPGDWRQFCILAARLSTPHFDFERPLWEMHVVEGLDKVRWLPKGSFAFLIRVHHAAVDGSAAVQLLKVLHELSADATTAPSRDTTEHVGEEPPGLAHMLLNAGVNNTKSLLRLSKPLYSLAAHALPSIFLNQDKTDLQQSGKVPRTRFNDRVSPYRVFASQRYSFDVIREFKSLVAGATVNDAVVTIIAGALRRYLERKSELPDRSMVAMMPVNTRAKGSQATAHGNEIVLAAAAIHTEIEDPVVRMEAIKTATSNMKSFINGVGAAEMTDLTRYAPEATLAFAGKLISMMRIDTGELGNPVFNVAISNVPGPRAPLYFGGAELRHFSVVAPVMDGMGLAFGVASYNGSLSIFPTACREMLPDPEVLAACLDQSYAECNALVGGTN